MDKSRQDSNDIPKIIDEVLNILNNQPSKIRYVSFADISSHIKSIGLNDDWQHLQFILHAMERLQYIDATVTTRKNTHDVQDISSVRLNTEGYMLLISGGLAEKREREKIRSDKELEQIQSVIDTNKNQFLAVVIAIGVSILSVLVAVFDYSSSPDYTSQFEQIRQQDSTLKLRIIETLLIKDEKSFQKADTVNSKHP